LSNANRSETVSLLGLQIIKLQGHLNVTVMASS